MIVVLSFLALIYVLVSDILGLFGIWPETEPGWASLMLSIWCIGGIQLISIGLIGQYIGKIYVEVKQRPRYHIETFLSAAKDSESQN